MVAAIIAALSLSGASAGGASLSVVYFYPRDQTATMTATELDTSMAGVQHWYNTQVGSTFALQNAQVIRGQRDAAYYQDSIWVKVLTELGYYCGTGIHVLVVHPSLPFMGGGTCDPLYESGVGGGTAMISEGAPVGGWAHDLGHAFALPHPKDCGIVNPWPAYCSETVMWSHWFYPDVGLLELSFAPEISSLQASPWFGGDPEPVEGCKPFKGKGKALGRCR